MIRTAPRTDPAVSGLVLSGLLVIGLSLGFVLGQIAPDILGGPASSVTAADMAPALTRDADYGIRHPAGTVPLSEADDYGTRHLPGTPLGPADDYGTRHPGEQP